MAVGKVYILVNPFLEGILKIGKTNRSSEERASELSGTSVPGRYIVLFDEDYADCDLAEKLIHQELSEYRVNHKREFFKVAPKVAVRAFYKISARPEVQHRSDLHSSEADRFQDPLTKDPQRSVPRRWSYEASAKIGQPNPEVQQTVRCLPTVCKECDWAFKAYVLSNESYTYCPECDSKIEADVTG